MHLPAYEDGTDRVFRNVGIKKFTRQGITQKKAYNHCIHFKTRNSPAIDMKIGYNNKLIPSVLSTKFLGLTILCMVSWRMHINQLH